MSNNQLGFNKAGIQLELGWKLRHYLERPNDTSKKAVIDYINQINNYTDSEINDHNNIIKIKNDLKKLFAELLDEDNDKIIPELYFKIKILDEKDRKEMGSKQRNLTSQYLALRQENKDFREFYITENINQNTQNIINALYTREQEEDILMRYVSMEVRSKENFVATLNYFSDPVERNLDATVKIMNYIKEKKYNLDDLIKDPKLTVNSREICVFYGANVDKLRPSEKLSIEQIEDLKKLKSSLDRSDNEKYTKQKLAAHNLVKDLIKEFPTRSDAFKVLYIENSIKTFINDKKTEFSKYGLTDEFIGKIGKEFKSYYNNKIENTESLLTRIFKIVENACDAIFVKKEDRLISKELRPVMNELLNKMEQNIKNKIGSKPFEELENIKKEIEEARTSDQNSGSPSNNIKKDIKQK